MRLVSRDDARTPMQWDESRNAGFSAGRPWIPVNPNYGEINGAAARADPDSVWHHYRRLIELRHTEPAVALGDFTMLLPDDERVSCMPSPGAWPRSSCSCWATSQATLSPPLSRTPTPGPDLS